MSCSLKQNNMAEGGRSLKSFWLEEEGNIGNHWSSVWLEWMDQRYRPFRASGVFHPTPEQDCCLGLNCEMAFYRPARQRGVLQTSTKLVSHESTTNKLSKTIQGTMLHKTAHVRARQECGSCNDLTLWESSVWTREATGPPATPLGLTAKVKLQRSCHKKKNMVRDRVRQCENES